MEITNDEIQQYCERITSAEPEQLQRVNRDTHAEVLNPRMLSGHLQGRFFAMISKMIQPKCVLEIGTYTGYSALCFAEGISKEGKIITIDMNEELEGRVRKYFEDAGVSSIMDYRIGDAREIIPTLTDRFDLVYIDADKTNYATYYDLVFDNLNVGGFIVSDNVLWDGKVIDQVPDRDTQVMLDYNQKIRNDSRVENILVPLRDGISLVRKIRS